MQYHLLLADPCDATRPGQAPQLHLALLETPPGGADITAYFSPPRTDGLAESAREVSKLVYRILTAEDLTQTQLVARFQVLGESQNVIGRSADLLFALAMICTQYEITESAEYGYTHIAATGVMTETGAVKAVDFIESKLSAAIEAVAGSKALILFPEECLRQIDIRLPKTPPNIHLFPVSRLEDALEKIGIVFEHVSLSNPFRGLEYFDFANRTMFFGREENVREFVSLLLRREASGVPGALIESASGSGKSSFARAGVLAALWNPKRLEKPSQTAVVQKPFCRKLGRLIWSPASAAMAPTEADVVESVVACWSHSESLPVRWAASTHTLSELAVCLANAWPTALRFVWVIDQMEELTQREWCHDLLKAFFDFLALLQANQLWTVATIRADATPALKSYDSFRAVFGTESGAYYLAPLARRDLERVITRPAAAAGLRFDSSPTGIPLEHMLLDDAAREGSDSLPLLQFSLDSLYKSKQENVLLYSTYQGFGGIAGSIERIADAIINRFSPNSGSALDRMLRALVSVDEHGKAYRRKAPLDDFDQASDERVLVQAFIESRLCVTNIQHETSFVYLAHEALLRNWLALKNWLSRESSLLQRRDVLAVEASRWQQHQRRNAWLITSAERLRSFQGVFEAGIPVAAVTRDFYHASHTQSGRARALRRISLATIIFVAVIAGILGFRYRAENQVARHAIGELFARKTWEAVDQKEPLRALRYAIASLVVGGDNSSATRDALIRSVWELRNATVLSGHDGNIKALSYSTDGAQLLTASLDGTARVWDAQSGHESARIKVPTPLHGAGFSPDGTKVVTVSTNSVDIWDSRDGKKLLHLFDNDDASSATRAKFSPSGRRVAVDLWPTSGHITQTRLFDASTGSPIESYGDLFGNAVLSPDDSVVASVFRDQGEGGVVLNVFNGAKLALGANKEGYVAAHGEFSEDGQQFLTTSQGWFSVEPTDFEARLWDGHTGRLTHRLKARDGSQIRNAEFSPDSATVLITTRNNPDYGTTPDSVLLFDAKTGKTIGELENAFPSMTAHFASSGRRIVYSGDSEWTYYEKGNSRFEKVGHVEPRGSEVAISPQEHLEWASIFSEEHAAIIDRLDKPHQSLECPPAAFARMTSDKLAAACPDGSLLIIDLHSSKRDRLDGQFRPVEAVEFSYDDSLLLCTSSNSNVWIWDLLTLKRLPPQIASDNVSEAHFAHHQNRILLVLADGRIRISDPRSGDTILEIKRESKITQAELSQDDKRVLALSADGSVAIWSVDTQHLLNQLSPDDTRTRVNFSPGGEAVLLENWDGNIQVWDLLSNSLPITIQDRSNGSWSADGRQILTTTAYNSDDNDFPLAIYSADNGTLTKTIGRNGDSYFLARFSADGSRVITVANSQLAVWDVHTGHELLSSPIAPLRSEGKYIDVALSPDSTQAIVTRSDPNTELIDLQLLTMDMGELRGLACKMLPLKQQIFTPEEVASDPLIRDFFLRQPGNTQRVCE